MLNCFKCFEIKVDREREYVLEVESFLNFEGCKLKKEEKRKHTL